MKKWWMESVGYQIYPKSFFDSNNDGNGDLNGITKKLPYLNDLGINLIWICPFYESPMDDNGYDVSDFFNVSKDFGTLEDFKVLLKTAKELNIKVILDFVLNHTSDEHSWFLESRSSLDNDKRDYYIWEDGRTINGKELPPTNWGSFFSGSAWNKDELTNQYYMKIFSNKMPDLNWENKEVRKSMLEVGKWWLDLGVDGFRIDAVSHLQKDHLIDSDYGKSDEVVLDWNKFSNLPKVHDYLQELNEGLFSKYDALSVGEVGGSASIESGLKYSGFDSNQLSMVFNFDHNWCNNLGDIKDYSEIKVDLVRLKSVFNNWQTAFKDKGWLPLNWLNHDQPRLMSHYGNQKFFKESAKALATSLYLMRGTPFIYQGEEIGMTNYPFKKLEEFRDVSSINRYHSLENMSDADKVWLVNKNSRDQARTPIQWDSSPYGGFSTVEPWININPNYKTINVENNLNDPNSILNHYKKVINLRRFSKYKELFVYGDYKQLELNHEELYIYERTLNEDTVIVITSFSELKLKYNLNNYDIEEVLLSNYQESEIINSTINLKPYQSIVVKVRRK